MLDVSPPCVVTFVSDTDDVVTTVAPLDDAISSERTLANATGPTSPRTLTPDTGPDPDTGNVHRAE